MKEVFIHTKLSLDTFAENFYHPSFYELDSHEMDIVFQSLVATLKSLGVDNDSISSILEFIFGTYCTEVYKI